jgi:hypothetical protein
MKIAASILTWVAIPMIVKIIGIPLDKYSSLCYNKNTIKERN